MAFLVSHLTRTLYRLNTAEFCLVTCKSLYTVYLVCSHFRIELSTNITAVHFSLQHKHKENSYGFRTGKQSKRNPYLLFCHPEHHVNNAWNLIKNSSHSTYGVRKRVTYNVILCSMKWNLTIFFLPWRNKPPVGQDPLNTEVSRPQTVGLLWTRDQPDAETST
jgi:hypothetical protein